MSIVDDKFIRLYRAYIACFSRDPEWGRASMAKMIADMEEALRLKRPFPEETLPNSSP